MAVLISSEIGWVISHELYIRNLYKKTINDNEVKSYHLKAALFDIKIPFIKKKIVNNNSNIIETNDVATVKKAHDILYNLYISLNDISSSSPAGNNQSAKSLADKFYSQLTRHPDSNFLGGNSCQDPLVTKIGEELYLIPEKSLFYCYDIKDISEHLKNNEFDMILMDPPWWNKFIRRKRKKNSKFGYEMVYDKDLSKIPIDSLLSKDGIIGIWCTSAPSHIKAVLTELFPAWNVQYISQWFWLKVTTLGTPICDFSQTLHKQPFERIIFGIKKNCDRTYPNPEEEKVIMSVPSAIHSHKPPLCELLKCYLPKNPKCLDLFARYLLPLWTSYGNEVLKLQHMSLYDETKIDGT